MKKTLVVIMSLLMLLPLIASCADTPAATEEQTTAASADTQPQQTEAETENLYDENGYLKDEIPAGTNLGSVKLRMLYWSDVSAPEFFVEDTTGEVVNDAIYNRNQKVEERLNVGFEYIGTPGNNTNREAYLKYAQNAASGGDKLDIYAAYSMSTALVAYSGLCRNLSDYQVIDLEKPWWPESLTSEATIKGRLYFLSGDISTNLIYTMYGIYFNGNLVSEYKLENPYDCVKNNTWTYDKLFEMAKAAETDSTGTDVIYGFTSPSNVYLDPFFFAAGLRTVEFDSDGNIKVADSFHNETTEKVAGEVWDFLHQSYCNFTDSKYDAFLTSKSIFLSGTCLVAKNLLQDVSFTYGIVPYPKYSAEQENYTTLNGFTYTLYAISTSSDYAEASATALECLGSESYRIITPALFEITMKARYSESADAAEMFDIIRETVTFDIGRIFTSSLEKLTYNIFRNNISAATKSSYLTLFKSSQKILEKKLDALNSQFDKIAAGN